ncbi:hypothetical protein ACP275_01G015600 [Erythranthe tilingii]
MACLHDHSCDEHDCSTDWSLYKHIDLSKVSALNEAVPGSVKTVFRAWEQRLNSSEGILESNEGDPELIVFIPFTSDVKIKSISVVGGADGTSPAKIRAFAIGRASIFQMLRACNLFRYAAILFSFFNSDIFIVVYLSDFLIIDLPKV